MSDIDFTLPGDAGEVAALYGAGVHCTMNIIPITDSYIPINALLYKIKY